MEQKRIGKFLSTLRKSKGYTQQQVADFLCVSNRTVSKWECDDGYPEITILLAIAELYGVTVDEILKGEKADDILQKAQEHKKIPSEGTKLRLKNCIIVSLALGITAAILSFVFSYNFSKYILRFTNIFIFLLFFFSVIVFIVAYNNYFYTLKSEGADRRLYFNEKIRMCFYISLEVFLFLSIGIGMFYYNCSDDFVLPLMLVVAPLISGIINRILKKCIKY